MSNVDDWTLDVYNYLNESDLGYGSFKLANPIEAKNKNKAILYVEDDTDTTGIMLNVDELEALATLLLYKAKLIRENDNNA